jgi:hypothetical protein
MGLAREQLLADLRDVHAQVHASLVLSREFLAHDICSRAANLKAIARYRRQRRALATAIALIERRPARVQ